MVLVRYRGYSLGIQILRLMTIYPAGHGAGLGIEQDGVGEIMSQRYVCSNTYIGNENQNKRILHSFVLSGVPNVTHRDCLREVLSADSETEQNEQAAAFRVI